MKKLTLSLMALFVVLALAACGQKAAETPASRHLLPLLLRLQQKKLHLKSVHLPSLMPKF